MSARQSAAVVKAYYGTRRGGSGVRPIRTEAEAEKILRGGYGVTSVRLETESGEQIGERWKDRGRWLWAFDPSYFQGEKSNVR
jgi:hypothetical protein